jgi:hypothetical protein
MTATATTSWPTASHHKTVSLTVYLISVAVLITALAVTLAISLADAHTSTSPGTPKPHPAVQDYCNIRPVGAPC